MKNEHIIYAYADRPDGRGKVLFIGITDLGVEFLNTKQTLVIEPPRSFGNVQQIVIYKEKDKATLKETLRRTGLVVSEYN